MMTTTEIGINVQLLQDLRQKYPEVAEHVITSCVRQNKNDRKKCIEALDKETPNALFGNEFLSNRFQDMHINDQRSRSDSASSGISSTSTSSSSSYKVNTDFRPLPMERTFTSDLNQFVKVPNTIPNIECSVSSSQSSHAKPGTQQSGMRQIPVQHIQTIRSPQDQPSGNSPLVYNIIYQTDNRSHHGGQHLPHPNYINNHGNINTHGNINYSLTRSPITSHSNANQGPPVAQRSISVQPGLSHHNQVNMNIVRLPPGDRTPVYDPGDYNVQGLHPSQSDSYLMGIDNGASHGNHGNSYFSPLFVSVGPSPPPFPNEVGLSRSANDLSRPDINIAGAVNPPSFPKYLPDPLSVGPSHSDNGHFYPHYNNPNDNRVPPIASRSSSSESDHSVIGNPDGERRHVSTFNFTPKAVPSPSSSPSSLSSDSSHNHPPEIPRRTSGNIQEEAAYTQALISFQRDRMLKLKQDLETESRNLRKLRSNVNQMEKNMLENRRTRNTNCFPSIEDIAKLREQKRQLQADIQVMNREIDQHRNGGFPVGTGDPNSLEQQNFFQNMNPGQRGSIFSNHHPEPRSESPPPPLPPRINAIPPAPPVQGLSGSGDSDGDGEQWSCSACTFLNHPALNKCECCEMPRINASPPSTGRVCHAHPGNPLCYCHDK